MPIYTLSSSRWFAEHHPHSTHLQRTTKRMATTIAPSIICCSRTNNSRNQNTLLLLFKPNNIAPSNSKINLKFSSCKHVLSTRQRPILQSRVGKSHRAVVADSNFNEADSTSESYPNKEATIDLQLPRRSMLVQFTCNACGVRTERLMNRLAYERGTVFVQCAGCLKHHKLVDNLGIVVEYNLLEETTTDLNESV